MTVREIIAAIDEPVTACIGDDATPFSSVGALDNASQHSFVFCNAPARRIENALDQTPAAVVVVGHPVEERPDRCFIQVTDPMRWYVQAIHHLFPDAGPQGLIHPSAVVGTGASIGINTEIGQNAVIEDGAVIGANTRIAAGAVICGNSVVGDRCTIGINSCIGSSGLAVARTDEYTAISFPHLGETLIGDDVDIGANTTIVRGILKDTIIGRGTKIANQVNVGHNCTVGEDCWISARAVLCGSVDVGARAMIGVGGLIYNRVSVGEGARVGLGSVVIKPVKPGDSVFGVPAKPIPYMRQF